MVLGTSFLIKPYVTIALFLESLSLQNPKFNVTNDSFGSTIVVIMITLRALASITILHSLQDYGVDIYALNLINKILHIAKECIPNRVVTMRPSDPPWITTTIKGYIRKRKRIIRKAKQTDSPHFWSKFRKIRNKVTSLIRDSKSSSHKSIADKLKSESISSRDWWPTIKSFISIKSSSTIPPLEKIAASTLMSSKKPNY